MNGTLFKKQTLSEVQTVEITGKVEEIKEETIVPKNGKPEFTKVFAVVNGIHITLCHHENLNVKPVELEGQNLKFNCFIRDCNNTNLVEVCVSCQAEYIQSV